MHYTAEKMKRMRGEFVREFLNVCAERGLPLSAEDAMEYADKGWRVDFCIENYAARIS